MAQFEIIYIRDGQTKVRCMTVLADSVAHARAIVRCHREELGWFLDIISCTAL